MVELEKYSCNSKHIVIRFHLIQQSKQEGTITLKYCRTNMMIADAFTKPIRKSVFQVPIGNLNLNDKKNYKMKKEIMEINH